MGGPSLPAPDPRQIGFVRVPLWLHAVALGVLLLALAPFSRPVDLWTADEGAVRLQVEVLVEDSTWTLPRPLVELDPAGVTVPIHDAVVVGDRFVPFSKQPLSPLLMTPFQAALGRPGAIVPSLLGAVLAAFFAGRIGARFGVGVAIASVWVVGLLSPVLLYGFTVLGHTAGTAVAAALLVSVVAALEGRRRSWPVAVVLAGLGPAFRSEAVIFAGAVGAMVILTAVVRRSRRDVGWGIAVGLGGLVGLAANLALQVVVAGEVATTIAQGESGFLARVVGGLFDALLRPDTDTTATAVVIVFMVAMAGALGVILRRDRDNGAAHLVFALLVAVPAVWLLWRPTPAVWGLLVALPVLVFGLACIDRVLLRTEPTRFLLGVAVVFAAGVFLTQVEGAGGHQWGGRYLMLALPAVVPVAVAAAAGAIAAVSRRSRVVAVTAVLVASLVMMGLSWRALRDVRLASRLLSDTIGTALEAAGDAGDGAGPVLISPVVQIGRQGWRHVVDNRFVMVPEADYPAYVQQVGGSDLRTVLVVDRHDSDGEQLFVDAGFTVEPGPASPVPLVDFTMARR